MYLLDSDLRGPLADYTFHYRRQPAGNNPPSSDESDRAEQSNWAARALGAMAPRIFGKVRMEEAAR
ncbi:hypothetical protein M3I54_08650 [Paraburkholderia sp. CNPSo 3274]|uniref:hypothetical protein n=1 Tax=Paraburkholderia sp. CNPSo 3274 TaxID=2940932 RepID=UPI0020B769AD|nr:hypothetical protein [Paraburkholderia sp. CNPSo 3274]MCP3707052.1 hypothetical protein [Paraburkholderia sp. CNPSo 3274]